MTNIEYKIIPLTKDNITLLEKIRYNAYDMNINDFPPENTFHTKNLEKGKYLVFGCYINNQLIGACYTSNSYNSLYIEQLFILKEYQNSQCHLGTNLLKFVLNNKNVIENYFNSKFSFSYLEKRNETSNIYESLGYVKNDFHMKKRL